MSTRTISIDDRLYDYLLTVSVREPSVLADLRAETAQLPNAGMQISPDQGQLMRLLVELIGARRCIEIDVVDADASPRHDPQVRRRSDDLFRHLGFAADD